MVIDDTWLRRQLDPGTAVAAMRQALADAEREL